MYMYRLLPSPLFFGLIMSTGGGTSGGGSRKLTDNAQARLALAARRRRRDEQQQQRQNPTTSTGGAAGRGGGSSSSSGGGNAASARVTVAAGVSSSTRMTGAATGRPLPAPPPARPSGVSAQPAAGSTALSLASASASAGGRYCTPSSTSARSGVVQEHAESSAAAAAAASPLSTVRDLLSSVSSDLRSAAVGGDAAPAAAIHAADDEDPYRIRRVDFGMNGHDLGDELDGEDAAAAAGRGRDDSANWSVDGDEELEDNNDAALKEEEEEDDNDEWDYTYLRPSEPDEIDATCLTYGSALVIKSYHKDGEEIASVSALDPAIRDSNADTTKPRYCNAAAVADGTGTDSGEDLLILCRGNDSGAIRGLGGEQQQEVLRYGDVVALSCPYAQGRSLGVRKVRYEGETGGSAGAGAGADASSGTTLEVGFYRTVRGQAERWEVLPSRGGRRRVAVGSDAALASAAGNSKRSNAAVPGSGTDRRRAVRSADPVVLRNVQTGGLLSLGGHDVALLAGQGMASPSKAARALQILTTSYQTTAGGGASTGNDRTLLDFLQHHDRVNPSPVETFRLIQAAVPTCPAWIVDSYQSGGTAEDTVLGGRPYLDGTYLVHPRRDDDLPGGPVDSVFPGRKQRHEQYDLEEPLAKQPVPIQEQILLDEVLGSLMGLEGRYIRATAQNNGMKHETSEIQSLHFTLAEYSAIGGTVDTSLGQIINRILPLSSDFVIVDAFLSSRLGRYEYGSVAHALAEAMDALVQEFLALATHMEALYMRPSGLTLSKLFVLLQPSVRTMEVLRRVTRVAAPLKGGALLNVLSSLMEVEFLGDAKAQEVLTYLLDIASVPYLSMLRDWLDNGSLRDSYGEFMIERAPEGGGQRRDVRTLANVGDNWIHWFIVRDEHILSSLSMTGREQEITVNKVLTTGRYWNAIQLCSGGTCATGSSREDCSGDSKSVDNEDSERTGYDDFVFTRNSMELSAYIDRSYSAASEKLRGLILGEYELIDTLRVMKRYFLLDQGDYFVHFLDLAEAELLKEMTDVSRGRTQSWLGMSIHPSGTTRALDSTQSFAEYMASSIQANFATESLVDRLDDLYASMGGMRTQEARTPSRHLYGAMNRGLTGIEAFTLNFNHVPFPVSLVLSHMSITSYQLLFRHLFFVKHVERRLVGTWLDHQSMKEFQSLRKSLTPTFGLRQRMLHFIQNLVYYMMFEVIEPNWQEMENQIITGKISNRNFGFSVEEDDQDQTIDDVLTVHNGFLRKTLKECLLTNGDLVRTLTKLMTTCLLFSDQMKLFVETTQINEERDRIAMEERHKRQQNISLVSKRSRLRKTAKTQATARKARWQEHTERLEQELTNDSYKIMIERFGQVFNNNLTDFMTQLHDSGDCPNLLARLDYNGFVSSSLNLYGRTE